MSDKIHFSKEYTGAILLRTNKEHNDEEFSYAILLLTESLLKKLQLIKVLMQTARTHIRMVHIFQFFINQYHVRFIRKDADLSSIGLSEELLSKSFRKIHYDHIEKLTEEFLRQHCSFTTILINVNQNHFFFSTRLGKNKVTTATVKFDAINL